MDEKFSDRRLYLGNLPKGATTKDVEELFKQHGHGEIVEVKLMNGFGFVEYQDAADARDVVPAYHGKEFMGERLVVQFARGTKNRKDFDNNAGSGEKTYPRPRRTGFKMNISGMANETSWQDLKDFARKGRVNVVYTEVSRERDGRGMVEFESADDLKTAIRTLDGTEFNGHRVNCVADTLPAGRDRDRSRSPRRREYSPAPARYRDSPPRGYGRDGRERSPPPPSRGYRDYQPRERSPRRDPYYAERRERERESYPPRSGHGHYDDGYPSKRYDDERYATNGRAYDDRRPPSPPRRRSPRRYEDEYSRRY